MTEVYIIQNHDQTYLTRHGEWVDGSDANQLFRSPHKDEAVNIKVEQSVRNPLLRLSVITCQINDKGQLQLDGPVTSSNIDSATEVLFNTEHRQTENSEPALGNSERATTL